MLFIPSRLSWKIIFSIFCLWILLFPRNALVALVSVDVSFKALNNINDFSLLVFPDSSTINPSLNVIFTWYASFEYPSTLIKYCFPYVNDVDVSSVTVTLIPSAEVFTIPFTSTVISLAVNPIVFKYLSVPFTGIDAVCLAGCADAVPATSQIGSTTSTTLASSDVVPPGIFTPDVIVVGIFALGLSPLPVGPLSVAIGLSAFVDTVIIPL